jgi:hypothetical protein
MALRRSNRSIEVFDIALMAVVTKAMGAFLVLMLLMLPSYNNLPAMQETVAAAEAKRQQLAGNVEALKRRNGELKAQHANETRLEDRRKALEEENKQLREGAITSLVLMFSWADCDADRFSFYARGENLKLADGGEWPAVQSGVQQAPPGVVQYGTASATTASPTDPADTLAFVKLHWLVAGMLDLYANRTVDRDLRDATEQRAQKQMLWAMNSVRPGARFAIYAKPGNLRGTCRPYVAALATDAVGRDDAAAVHWNDRALSPAQSGHVIHLGHVVWTGKELQLSDATAVDQTALNEQTSSR